MIKDPKKFLYDISESIDLIFSDHLDGINTLIEFENNRTVQDAVERRLMTIGEAIYKLKDEGIVLSLSDQMINRRNTLAHQYDAISAKTIWKTIQNELPSLKLEVDGLLSK